MPLVGGRTMVVLRREHIAGVVGPHTAREGENRKLVVEGRQSDVAVVDQGVLFD